MKQFHTCVGIDLARRAKHKAVIVSEDDAGVSSDKRAFAFSHDLKGFGALRDYLMRRTGGESLKNLTVNMEPTSGAWEVLSAFLRSEGASVYFTRTDVVSALRKVHSKFAKTDRIDARTLASVPFSFPERLIEVVAVEGRIRKLRGLSSQRQRLVEDTTRWKNRFVAKIETVWMPLLADLDDSQRLCNLVRAFFKRFSDPRKVRRYGRERFEKWCAKSAHGNTSPKVFEILWQGALRCAELWDNLDNAMALDWETLFDLIKQDLHMIETLEKQIGRIDEQIKKARKEVPECDLLEEMPGVGKVISVTLAAILMPIERFANAKKCGAYTGFTSRRKSTAGHEIEGLKITKTGNRRLKRDLALAADTAMKNDPQLTAFAIRLLKAGKHYNKVRVAVGRKIAVRAYSLLKRYRAGQTNVQYIWRDPDGRAITKQQAKRLAARLWTAYKADNAKGSSPKPAIPWPSEDATKRRPSELPARNYARTLHRKSTPKQPTVENHTITCAKPMKKELSGKGKHT